jgi:hypothetical protein
MPQRLRLQPPQSLPQPIGITGKTDPGCSLSDAGFAACCSLGDNEVLATREDLCRATGCAIRHLPQLRWLCWAQLVPPAPRPRLAGPARTQGESPKVDPTSTGILLLNQDRHRPMTVPLKIDVATCISTLLARRSHHTRDPPSPSACARRAASSWSALPPARRRRRCPTDLHQTHREGHTTTVSGVGRIGQLALMCTLTISIRGLGVPLDQRRLLFGRSRGLRRAAAAPT